MDADGRALHQGLVTFLRILLGGVAEKARADGHADAVEIGTARYQLVLVAIHDADEFYISEIGVDLRLRTS